MPQILLIDDDQRLGELLGRFFERYDIGFESVTTPSAGLARLACGDIDLVVLDVMLPEMDGFELCKQIRRDSTIPIIMLTARGEVMDRIVGLELGADDYLPKPFEPRELVARINTVLKRISPHPHSGRLHAGPLTVDSELRQVLLDGVELHLSSGEYQLLELFASHPGKTFHRDEILNHLKGTEVEIYTRAVDILVSRLRHKLKPHDLIKTVRGSGYCLVGRPS